MDLKRSIQLDRIGMGGSILCAIHCALAFFVPGALGLMGLDILLGSGAEWTLTAVAIGIGCVAFFIGFPHHKQKKLATLFLAGILTLLLSRFIEEASHGHSHAEDSKHEQAHAKHPLTDQMSTVHEELRQGEHGHNDHESGLNFHFLGTLLGIFGGLMMAAAHFLSLKFYRECQQPDPS